MVAKHHAMDDDEDAPEEPVVGRRDQVRPRAARLENCVHRCFIGLGEDKKATEVVQEV
jgi:hypothetical protein